jgi:hypothetical protein
MSIGVSFYFKNRKKVEFPHVAATQLRRKKSILAIQHRLQGISSVLAKSISICSTYSNVSR